MQEIKKRTAAVTHPDYDKAACSLKLVRDCVEGSPTIKREKLIYVPNPIIGQDLTDEKARREYYDYVNDAEFDSDTDQTRRTLLGKMRFEKSTIELPEKIAGLVQDVDGDGTSLTAMMQSATDNVLQTKYTALVADYSGLGSVDLESVSIADAREVKPRALVKQYTRECICNWAFSRIDGKMQLTWVDLVEYGTEFDEGTKTHTPIESHLELGIDEIGYYQKKVVYGKSGKDEGEKSYVTVAGKNLKWIPIQFYADEKLQAGTLPIQAGFLYNVADLVLHKFRMSADYKLVLKALIPTIFSNGWKNGDGELFETLNGRKHFVSGPRNINQTPEGVSNEVLGTDDNTQAYERYIEQTNKKINSIGGISKIDSSKMTATEAEINASEQNALLSTIASSCENAFKRVISYCAMFEGLWSPDEVENKLDEIMIELPRDFARPKLTPEEVTALSDIKNNGGITRDTYVRALFKGGVVDGDPEDEIERLDNEPPPVITQ